MSATPKRRTVTYIVRIWAEYLTEQPPRWYGVIEIVSSGHKKHFSELDEISDFIHEQTTMQIRTEDQQ